MAILLGRRRLVGIRLESTTGTLNPPALGGSIDNTPLLRSAKMTAQPISVERPTLRLTLTPIGDIYPGKSLGTMDVSFELSANSTFTGDATSTERPNLTRWMSACGFAAVLENLNVRGRRITLNTDNGPMRHGELVIGTGVTVGNVWTVIGDTYSDDGVMYVSEAAGGTLTGGTLTGQVSGTVFNVSLAGTINYAWAPSSDLNARINAGTNNASLALYDDGKLWLMKGAGGNAEFQFRHGDAVVCNMSMRGVIDSYADVVLPANALDFHKYPPTFLGSRLTLRESVNNPTSANKYGTDGAGAVITGALNSLNIRTNNEIVLHENSMDPNGVNYAVITGRKPEGDFNPDEVREAEFSFFNRFFNGTPLRMKVSVVGPPAGAVVFDNPTTFNQNAFDFVLPGLVVSGLGDGDRDGINAWDGAFKLTGGNYTAAVAASETPGSDNEFILIHR